MLVGNKFGDVGSWVVIEEFLVGEEVSFICMVDGKNVLFMVIFQDYKVWDNNDLGLNIGGMGVYFFVLVVMSEIQQWVMDEVIYFIVCGMEVEGNIYIGFLYVGLMISKDGIFKVLEYNCCFGDLEI